MPAAPQEDAALMAAASQLLLPEADKGGNKSSSSSSRGKDASSTSAPYNSATNALARSNLLRLETCELISESLLHIHPASSSGSSGDGGQNNSNNVHYEAKWAPSVRSYLDGVKRVVGGLGEATLGPDVALLPTSGTGGDANASSKKYRIPLLSDKYTKSQADAHSSSTASSTTSNANPLTSWSFPFPGGNTLSLLPIGSFAHVGNAGLSNRHANGNVVPVLDVAVLFNGSVVGGSDDGEEEGNSFVGGKDYLNHRYTDKRNILAVHIAKQLSQKKHRSKVGAVHLTNVFGDSRKVGLVLTPPLDEEGETKKKKDGKKKKKKRKHDEEEEEDEKKKGGKKKKNKLRFRIRLIFGVKPADQGTTSSRQTHDDDNEYSTDEESTTKEDAFNSSSWIPSSRLLPNRSNITNRSTKHNNNNNNDDTASITNATPHYTNALAEDLHLLSTTNLISSTVDTLTPTSTNNTISPKSSFHETLLLLKVWALQRGLLRGHDTFTTTTLATLLVYLYRIKVIGKRMGGVQGFIAFMKFWSETDWLGDDYDLFKKKSSDQNRSTSTAATAVTAVRGRKLKNKVAFVIPTMGSTESSTIAHCPQSRLYQDDVRGITTADDGDTPKTLLDCFKAVYTSFSGDDNVHQDSPILLDPTMTINYLARLSPSFVRESRSEACLALRYIHGYDTVDNGGSIRMDEGSGGAFRKLFLETNRFWNRYDAYVRVPLSLVPKIITTGSGGGKKKKHGKGGGSSNSTSGESKVWGHNVDDLGYDESVCRSVVEVLSRALGDRATAIRALTCGNGDIRAMSNDAGSSNEDIATRTIVDSDQCQVIPIRGSGSSGFGYLAKPRERTPTSPVFINQHGGEQFLVVGLRIDPNASRRIVDRGPPAEDIEGSNAFVALWGEQYAQLRRFQDGAIVRAIVWNNAAQASSSGGDHLLQFAGMDRSMGGIVERIVQHIVKLHFTDAKYTKKSKGGKVVAFELRNMASFIDGIASPQPSPFSDSLVLHKNVMTAFDSLAEFLRRNTSTTYETAGGRGKKASKLGLPLSVDEVEPLSPCLRYSSLFPPVPHPLLGGTDSGDKRKISGVNPGEPILIQIRFEGSSKWPTSLNAMCAAKCAMLIQLAEGIERMKQESSGGDSDLGSFDGPIDVTPNYMDIGYRGYSWRIIVRADQELRMLKGLRNPTKEARALQLSLIDRHVRGSMHHSLIHAVHTRNPSASSVARLAHRWVASHMLSDMIPTDAIELLVAKIYTESSSEKKSKSLDAPPSTVVAGFLKFLHLLSTHDWSREPIIVDPQNHISVHDRGLIHAQFNTVRGPDFRRGPAMYIVSPADYEGVEEMAGSKVVGEKGNDQPGGPADAAEKIWAPSITAKFPEQVVLSRAAALAKCSHNHLTTCAMNGKTGNDWVAAFQESSASLTSYSALLRVDTGYIIDPGCSSTDADCSVNAKSKTNESELPSGPFERSLQKRYAGPKELRKKNFKNLVLEKDTLHEWQPVKALVRALRSKFNDYAVFFYNEFAPDVIAMIWRPDAFKPQPFSAIVSEFKRPAAEYWKDDSLVITNTDDLMAEIGHFARHVVSNFKVFDDKKPNDALPEKPSKKLRQTNDDDDSSDSEGE